MKSEKGSAKLLITYQQPSFICTRAGVDSLGC